MSSSIGNKTGKCDNVGEHKKKTKNTISFVWPCIYI